MQNVIRKIAREHEINIVKMETDGNHIHLLVECTLQHYIPDVMKALKGVSARTIFRTFPTLISSLWGGHLWSPSYFIATVSENIEEQIRNTIQNQKKK